MGMKTLFLYCEGSARECRTANEGEKKQMCSEPSLTYVAEISSSIASLTPKITKLTFKMIGIKNVGEDRF